MADLSRLPPNAEDGAEVLDRNGRVWRYDAKSNTWVDRGSVGDFPIVGPEDDGLVTPNIVEQLERLKAVRAAGAKFNILKIYPAIDCYWYLLRSRNNTIRLFPESSTQLRIEVNKPRLLSLLSKIVYPGQRGDQGLQGPAGRDGRPGANEPVYPVKPTGNKLEISAKVVSSIGTPILLRIYKDNATDPSLVIKIPVDGQDYSIESADYEINIDPDNTTVSYDKATSELAVIITLTEPWDDNAEWTYKAWQMGRRGPRGPDGHNFLQVVPKEFEDDLLKSKNAIVSLRQGGTRGNLYYYSAPLFDKNCVSKLSFSNVCNDSAVDFDYVLAAVQMTTLQCKDITSFKFKPARAAYGTYVGGGMDIGGNAIAISPPPLVMPEWTPVEACWLQRHWPISQFKWTDLTEVSRDNVIWQTANERYARDPAYPWMINEPRAPGARCCSEDFFFCPNINDQPCAVRGPDGKAPVILPPPVPQLCCECDCPIALDLQDGYDFDEIGITSDRKVYIGVGDVHEVDNACQSITCTLDGSIHEYRLRVVVEEQRYPVSVTIHTKIGYSELCDEARNLYLNDANSAVAKVPSFSSDCGKAVPMADCPFEWSMRDVSSSGATGGLEPMSREGPDQYIASQGQALSMTFVGRAGTIDISILVNLQRVSCCLGYGLEACMNYVNRDDFPSPSIPPSPSPSASPSPEAPPPSPSHFTALAATIEDTTQLCGNCANAEDMVEWVLDVRGLKSSSPGVELLDGQYSCRWFRYSETCKLRGSPVATQLSTTGFVTMLAEMDGDEMVVLLTECDQNGFSTSIGDIGVVWRALLTCAQLGDGNLPREQLQWVEDIGQAISGESAECRVISAVRVND